MYNCAFLGELIELNEIRCKTCNMPFRHDCSFFFRMFPVGVGWWSIITAIPIPGEFCSPVYAFTKQFMLAYPMYPVHLCVIEILHAKKQWHGQIFVGNVKYGKNFRTVPAPLKGNCLVSHNTIPVLDLRCKFLVFVSIYSGTILLYSLTSKNIMKQDIISR